MSKATNLKVIIYSLILCALSMTIMITYAMKKEQNVTGEVWAQAETGDVTSEIDGNFEEIYMPDEKEAKLCIPLPDDYIKNEIKYKSDYVNRSVQICFSEMPKDYFKTHKISGNTEHVVDMFYYYEEGFTYLYLVTDGLYECKSAVEGKELQIEWKKPNELYEKIVVLDAGHGGEDIGAQGIDTLEKDIVLDVTLKVKKLLEESDIKVYCTRIDDKNISMEKRIALANEADADLFLSIHCIADENNASKFGMTTYYNDTYFIPEFGNADFAYEVEEKTTKYTSARALGMEAGEDFIYLIKHTMIPSAYLEIGYLSNEQENLLLGREEYRDKIAKGIYEAILSSYELIKE